MLELKESFSNDLSADCQQNYCLLILTNSGPQHLCWGGTYLMFCPKCWAYAWFNLTCYHPPPPPPFWQPPRQVQPFGPGGGELFEAVLSQQITCYFSCGLHRAVELKTTYFKKKMPKSGWRRINYQD